MAQAVLIDAVDCSGVDFEELISLLDENLATAQKQERKHWRCQLSCSFENYFFSEGLQNGARRMPPNARDATAIGRIAGEDRTVRDHPQ